MNETSLQSEVSKHLKDETRIVWLEDPRKYPYVREKTDLLRLRSRFPIRRYQSSKQFKLLGYSEISATAKANHDGFYRRVWYLMLPNDPYSKGSPGQAVKPSSIKVRVPSVFGRE